MQKISKDKLAAIIAAFLPSDARFDSFRTAPTPLTRELRAYVEETNGILRIALRRQNSGFLSFFTQLVSPPAPLKVAYAELDTNELATKKSVVDALTIAFVYAAGEGHAVNKMDAENTRRVLNLAQFLDQNKIATVNNAFEKLGISSTPLRMPEARDTRTMAEQQGLDPTPAPTRAPTRGRA